MTTVAGLDVDAVVDYLRQHGLATAGSVRVCLISGGRSNLTYALDVDGNRWVLRRPPLGDVLSTAHDMAREYTVMAALAGTVVPVPRAVALCDDPAVLGVPFYLMERVEGDVLRTAEEVRALRDDARVSVFHELVDVLAGLHRIDPDGVGLAKFGRPEGFMARQVRRWTAQLEHRRALSADMTALSQQLAGSVPESRYASIVHGDYRLDNCVVYRGRIVAVLDWEMSTLGDPLGDLAMFAVYHHGLADLPNPVVYASGQLPGSPTLADTFRRYAAATGFDVGDLSWYLGFAWFKLAAILTGVAHRAERGQAAGQQFSGVTELVDPCVARGLDALEGSLP